MCIKPCQTLRQLLVHPKDSIPYIGEDWSSIEDERGSCNKSYVGKTGRIIEHRLKEHRRSFSTPYYTTSAVAEHALENTHEINWSSAKVVDISNKFHQREAWNIRKLENKMK